MENSSQQYVMTITKKFTKIKNGNIQIEDNLIQKIFGGTLVSSVICGNCKKYSNKVDKFIDISLVKYSILIIRKLLIATTFLIALIIFVKRRL